MQRVSRMLIWAGVVMLVLGTLIGYIIGAAVAGSGQKQEQANTAAGLDVRLKLNALLGEHAAVGMTALQAEFANRPDAAAAMQAVEANSAAIADTVESMHKGTRAEFLHLWRSHIDHYQKYLTAAKNSDQTDMNQAKKNLTTFANAVSDFFVKRNNLLDKNDLQQAIGVHGYHVIAIIDALVAGDYDTAHQTAHQAYEHMGGLANMLANAQ